MISRQKISAFLIVEIVLVLFVTTVTYFPNLRKATIYRDDWYYTMDRLLGGPQAFPEMFRIDRPARGVFFEVYYQLFGIEPAPYHALAFLLRLVLGLCTLWFFHLLWPKQRFAVALMAILFVLYPGYTRWMEGFEDQPKIASLVLTVTSFALTLEAIKARRLLPKILLWLGAIVTGWGYILLVDYAMGMEVFRFLCIFVFVNRSRQGRSLVQKGIAAIRAGAPGILVLGVFLFWRLFIFHNLRPETDIQLQLTSVAESPLVRGAWWLVHFFQSFVNDAVLAWAAPFFQELFALRLRDALPGLVFALAAGLSIAAVGYLMLKGERAEDARSAEQGLPPARWQTEAIWIGLIGVAAGVLPVVMANRSVAFGPFSHYALPASLAAAVLVVGLAGLLSNRHASIAVLSLLVILAVVNQYVASLRVLQEEENIAAFWHQMAWRAPGIREATGLMVTYPSVYYGEDVDAVNGPANFIYFPTPTNQLPVLYKLYAMKQYPWTAKEFLAGGKSTVGYRTHYGVIDNDYVLAISQPAENACLHVIDRRWPWFTFNDSDATIIVGQNSNTSNILPEGESPRLQESIFGPEPAHGWCYYFQKAELALQGQDWKRVVALRDEAAGQKYQPNEPLEWMPFLQAYAMLGDSGEVNSLVKKIAGTPYNRKQVCTVFSGMQKQGLAFSAEIENWIRNDACPASTPQ